MKSEVIIILEIFVQTFHSDREVISFDSTLEEALSVFRNSEKDNHTVSPEYAGLHQKIIAGKPSSAVRLLLQSIAYDQIEGKKKICQID